MVYDREPVLPFEHALRAVADCKVQSLADRVHAMVQVLHLHVEPLLGRLITGHATQIAAGGTWL